MLAVPAASQNLRIRCSQTETPAQANQPCEAKISRTDLQQRYSIDVQVVSEPDSRPVSGAIVRFRATNGALLPDSAVTDEAGNAHALWYRPRSGEPVAITVEARSKPSAAGAPDGPVYGSAMRLISLSTAPHASRLGVERWYARRAWFEKNQLPGQVAIHIYQIDAAGNEIVPDSATCASQRVAFLRFTGSGTVSPDTSIAGLLPVATGAARRADPKAADSVAHVDKLRADGAGEGVVRERCFALTRWTLGDGVGIRTLRASLVPPGSLGVDGPGSVDIDATSRALPRIVAGPVFAWRRSYLGVARGAEQKVTVERVRSDGSTATFDSTYPGPASVDSVSGRWQASAFIGASVPLIPRARLLSVTLGVDMKTPADDWYLGFSLLRFGGLMTEALPIDVQVLGHFGRSKVLRDAEACEAQISCKTDEETRFHGLGGVITVDASSLISEIIKKLGT